MTTTPNLLLAVDVGNSRIKFGLFDVAGSPAAALGTLPHCLDAAAVPVAADLPWEQIRRWERLAGALGETSGVIAGANPAGVERVRSNWPADFGPSPTVIEDITNFPLEVRVDEPRKVGIDRLLNAVAANVVRPAGTPAIVVDTGTATTIDLIAADGAFEGGAILPGIELSAKSLHHYTALLPLMTVEELAEAAAAGTPGRIDPLGRNTRAAIRSGLFWGQLGAIRQILAELGARSQGLRGRGGEGERGRDVQGERAGATNSERGARSAQPGMASGGEQFRDPHSAFPVPFAPSLTRPLAGTPALFLTGGGAPLLLPQFPESHFEPHLALQGLAIVSGSGR